MSALIFMGNGEKKMDYESMIFDLDERIEQRDAEIATLKKYQLHNYDPSENIRLNAEIAALKGRLSDHHRAILGRDAKIKELEVENKALSASALHAGTRLQKLQAFWEYSRLADKEQWEKYHWGNWGGTKC